MNSMNSMNSTHSTVRRALTAVATGSLLLALTACGDDSVATTTESPATESPATESTGAASSDTAAPVDELTITGAWARTSPMMATMGAAYMTITSPVDDRLLGADIDAAVAADAQVHEVVMVGSTDTTMSMGSDTTGSMGMGSDTTMAMGGEMTMREVDHVDLMAGMPVEFVPGGYHIMLIDLAEPLVVGASITITLQFETAGDVVVEIPVLDEAP